VTRVSPTLDGTFFSQPGSFLLSICPWTKSLKVFRGPGSPLTSTTNWFGGREGGPGFRTAQPEIRAAKQPSNATLFIVEVIVLVLSLTEMQTYFNISSLDVHVPVVKTAT
jgi:hypothetical protein